MLLYGLLHVDEFLLSILICIPLSFLFMVLSLCRVICYSFMGRMSYLFIVGLVSRVIILDSLKCVIFK